MGFDSFNMMSSVFPVIFIVIFSAIIIAAAAAAITGIARWTKNNNSPRIPVRARVAAKRTSVSGNGGGFHGDNDVFVSTRYHVTFEFESGDRQEFRVDSRDFGLMAEGDFGVLTFQGSRFAGFERFKNQ